MEPIYYQLDGNLRLDIYLAQTNQYFSRAYIANQIATGQIKVNDERVKASYKLKKGDKIYSNLSLSKSTVDQNIDLPIIYQDEYCLIVNKPSGMLTHAKGNYSEETSIASFIKPYLDRTLASNRAGIVHRLDRGTSGVILTAKSDYAIKYFQNQFAKRLVHKKYLAIVKGIPDQTEALINMPLSRDPKTPSRFTVNTKGKPAETTFKLVNTHNNYSLLLLTPKTGRTHQLRVHLKTIGLPIVGDTFYGGEPAARLMLHAYSLSLIIPDKGRMEFTAPLDPKFNDYVKTEDTSYA